MKSLEVALCDLDEDYIIKFASYMMEHTPAQIHVFTTPESYFADENSYDLELMTEEFIEIASFREKQLTGRRYVLCEDKRELDSGEIYKFQSMENILGEIVELEGVKGKAKASIKSKGKSKIIGVYSPISHELQLPFSMALGQSYRNEGKVLFLDLEELSIMPDLIGRANSKNLMDLLYEINTNNEKINLDEYVKGFMGFDYIEPFLNPNEIGEIDKEAWDSLFSCIEKCDYDVIVVLFGRAINGFMHFVERLDRLFVLGRPGDYFKKGQKAFIEYLGRAGIETEYEAVNLPMSAVNLSEGAYLLEELLQGNLGLFVERLLENSKRENG